MAIGVSRGGPKDLRSLLVVVGGRVLMNVGCTSGVRVVWVMMRRVSSLMVIGERSRCWRSKQVRMDMSVFPVLMDVEKPAYSRLNEETEESREENTRDPLEKRLPNRNCHDRLASLLSLFALLFILRNEDPGWMATDSMPRKSVLPGALIVEVMRGYVVDRNLRREVSRGVLRGRDKKDDGGGGVVVEAASPSLSVP